MPREIRCFLLRPTGIALLSLRRYRKAAGGRCDRSGWGYCNAEMPIGRGEIAVDADGMMSLQGGDEPPGDDAPWPAACACGYAFTPDDERQLRWEMLWRRADTGEEHTTRFFRPEAPVYEGPSPVSPAPPGAMWFADWLSVCSGGVHHQARGGGPHLLLRTPGGDWDIDSIAANGPGWERTGDPPNVTARPSILCNDYHGWLTAGVLVEC